eukprot:g27899.t1
MAGEDAKADDDDLEMIGENDPRVKKLQELAWSLQTVTNRPANRLPEDRDAKRAAYRVTSRALALCNNAEYANAPAANGWTMAELSPFADRAARSLHEVEVEDFVKRAKVLSKEIEDKKKEMQEIEEAIKTDLSGKCFRSTAARLTMAAGGSGDGVTFETDVLPNVGNVPAVDYEKVVLTSNKEGMDLLRKGQYKQAFEQLKYAEALVVSKQGKDLSACVATLCR